MNKQELIDTIAEQTDTPKVAVLRCIDAITETIQAEVAKGGVVRLTGFGAFDSVKVKARTGRNPQTGEAIPIPARMRARFTPGVAFRAAVKGE